MSFLPISGGPVSSIPVATGGGPVTTNVAGRVAAAGSSTSIKIAAVATAGMVAARGAATQNKIVAYTAAGKITARGVPGAGKIGAYNLAGRISALGLDTVVKIGAPTLAGRAWARGADSVSKIVQAALAGQITIYEAMSAAKVGAGIITADVAGYLAAFGGAATVKISTPSVSGQMWTVCAGTTAKIAQSAIAGLVQAWAEVFIGSQCSLTAQDLQAIADRVWHKVLEGGYAAIQMQRILMAGLAGSRAGIGTAAENYYAPDGVTPRIAFTPSDTAGNGAPVLDGGAVPSSTAGASLSSASLDAIANAVWAKVIDGALTAAESMRINTASVAGERAGLGTATERYVGLDGATDRITFVPSDADGNGTSTVNGA